MSDMSAAEPGERLAKVIARSGLCSRRDAEGWIKDGRVTVNGRKVITPAFNVDPKDKIAVDGQPLAARQGTRVWLYHKPAGLMVTEKDPEGRETVFDALDAKGLPRVVSIGRLDLNTEGLLLVTNDGGLKRVLELPATGWLRRYRVRAFGTITQAELDRLKEGIEVEGVKYGPIEAILERQQGANVWLVVALREGKNREVKNVLGALGLQVNRLIRVSYGPFQLGDLDIGEVETVPARVLREQLGKKLADSAGVDFDSEMPELAMQKQRANPKVRATAPGREDEPSTRRTRAPRRGGNFRFEDDTTPEPVAQEPLPRRDRPGRPGRSAQPPRPVREPVPEETRRVLFEDGREAEMKVKPPRRERGADDGERGARPMRPGGARPPRRDEDGAEPRRRAEWTGRKPARPGDAPERPRYPRADGDAPKRPFSRGTRPDAGGDKKPFHRSPRPEGGARPPRRDDAGAKKPWARKPEGDGASKPFHRSPRPDGPRPPRPDGPRPPRADGPRPPRRDGDRPDRADRPARRFDRPEGDAGKRPFRPKRDDAAPGGARPPRRTTGDRPDRGNRPDAGPRPPRGPRPQGGRPGGGSGSGPRPPRKPRP
jgi:23S rRNA pseudouridine2605 synthase